MTVNNDVQLQTLPGLNRREIKCSTPCGPDKSYNTDTILVWNGTKLVRWFKMTLTYMRIQDTKRPTSLHPWQRNHEEVQHIKWPHLTWSETTVHVFLYVQDRAGVISIEMLDFWDDEKLRIPISTTNDSSMRAVELMTRSDRSLDEKDVGNYKGIFDATQCD